MATFTPHSGDADPLATAPEEEEKMEEVKEEWAVWFDSKMPKGLGLDEYRRRVKLVANIEGLGELEKLDEFNSFKFVPEEELLTTGMSQHKDPFRFNLRLFRKGIAPFWEDQEDTCMIHTLRMPKDLAPIEFQMFWKALSRSLLTRKIFKSTELIDEDTGDRHPDFETSGILGTVVHYGRHKGYGTVEIWCSGPGPLPHDITTIIPKDRYTYDLTSKGKDALKLAPSFRPATTLTSQVPLVERAPRPVFEKPEAPSRQAFQPYETSHAPKRAFQKMGRSAGGGERTKVTVAYEKGGKKGGRGGKKGWKGRN
eukprot:TRINITY_DN1277_c2_g1_i1.p1 TRINITY_DN1277_c2_g1~~TRINITY_DN1277_c2_g1_i1.p1  ORF type:complete len:318 (+),score=63.99 TRINITY_DN1277_c2_g1_i1:24-956(+)